MLKKSFISIATKRRLKKRIISPSCNYSDASSIGIIVNPNEPLPSDLDDFISTFRNEGKTTYIVGVTSQNPTETKTVDVVLTPKDFSLTGDAKSEEAVAFLQHKFDFLILLDQSGDYLLEFFAVSCKALCIIGLGSYPKNELLTLQIATNKPNKLKDVLKYMKKIETND